MPKMKQYFSDIFGKADIVFVKNVFNCKYTFSFYNSKLVMVL